MAFGGGFGGFGSTNNNQSSGFGGFGSNTNTNSGFGANNNNNNNNNSPFGGTKPGFGSNTTSTGGGIFGSNNNTTANTGGFGGFGSTNNNTTTSGGFGASNTSTGGLFGNTANKTTGFGSSGGGLFGNNSSSNNTTSGGFGSGNASGGIFGSNNTSSMECQGTGSTPFTPFTEKEQNSNTTNNYQSITFLQPYLKWSFEELRAADYQQGRRYGNASGQPGAFGQSTFGGGFGSSNQNQNQNTTAFGSNNTSTGGLFGSNTAASTTGFGANNNNTTSGGFGGGGGLFGSQQNKPAGGLFGQSTSSQPSGGLFATAGSTGFGAATSNTTGGFGTGGTGGTGGGGLFGQQNNQQKSGFSFGGANNTATSTGGFGGFGTGTGTTGSTGGLFGQNNAGQTQNQPTSLFGGNNQQQQNAGGGLFGQQQNQNQNQGTGFGAGFGQQNQQKPGGLFGSTATNTGGGLFGNNQQQQQQSSTGGLFGTNTNNNNAGGGLFGKPANTGTGLFGNANNNTANPSGGGLFNNIGNNAQNQQNTGGIFGNNQQQQQKPSLFGNTNTGGGLFGNNQQNNQSGGLFGQSNNQNQNSLFGGSTNSLLATSQQNPLQQPQGLVASINDPTPYGSASIFNGLPPPPQDNPGPIATPIRSGQKQKKPAALPQYKINPAMASRLVTPRKQTSGYGFSYSTYGTPSSVSSVSSTPGGFSGSLLSGSLTRNLGKSLSTSNLRRTFDSDNDSVLSPGAFSSSSSRYSGGSLKRLTIDRSLRTDLFGPQAIASLPSPERSDLPKTPSILKKKVSFDAGITGGENGSNSLTSGSTDTSATPSAQEQGYLRPRPSTRTNGVRSPLVSEQPEMQQITGKELAIVPEDGSPEAVRAIADSQQSLDDPEPGNYWTKPPLHELKKMTSSQLKSLTGFVIGREGCGNCAFDQPVDISNIDLDDMFGKYAQITIRSITIYPTDVAKPPVGMGMNVPSILTLANSWPRKRNNRTPVRERSGPRLEKHIDRLKRANGTEFIDYNIETGEWTFKVPHFTTYGLEYDDEDVDEFSEGDIFQSSVLSEAPSTPTPKSRTPKSRTSTLAERHNEQDMTMATENHTTESSGPEDTFEFKTGRSFPGAFDDAPAFYEDQEMAERNEDDESFLDERSDLSRSDSEDEPSEVESVIPAEDALIHEDEMELAGSFPVDMTSEVFPKSILKTHRQASLGTPTKPFFEIENDWTEQLQRTISPKKQDREMLRQSQARHFRNIENGDGDESSPAAKKSTADGEIATSIDLMNSLFGKEEARRKNAPKEAKANKGFKMYNPHNWPYPKHKYPEASEMSPGDISFHNSFKPTWGPGDTLIYAVDEISHDFLDETATQSHDSLIVNRDVKISSFDMSPDITEANFRRQRDQAEIMIEDGVPVAKTVPWTFETGTKYSSAVDAHNHERLIWELGSILFDEHYDEIPANLSEDAKAAFKSRITKDRLAAFWARLCREEATLAVAAATTPEERAIGFLSMNKVAEACNALIEGKDYRLATLVAQIGGDRTMHDDITAQIDEWRKLNVLSEISDPVRTLYELLAGNTCTAVGKKGPLEDRAKTFLISERFDMSWQRSFGLKLWYSLLADDPLDVAVRDFEADLADNEIKRPTPWFLSGDLTNPTWNDPRAKQREDALWGLLKLYADKDGNAGTLSEAVGPENVNANPLSARLSFELYHTLAPYFPRHASVKGGDQITITFASELNSADQWLWALHVLLHLSDADQRQQALQDLLAERAGEINEDDQAQMCFLFEALKIPQEWVWEAKALYARAVAKNHVDETRFLLRAGNWAEAHATLCSIVAPQAIVERSYGALQSLLEEFKVKPSTWRTGGGVYLDYLRLVQNQTGSEEGAVLGRLVRVLSDMNGDSTAGAGESGGGQGNFLRNVAVQDMSSVVGDKVLAGAGGNVSPESPSRLVWREMLTGKRLLTGEQAKEQAWVLQLPLTAETKRIRAAEMSWGYYRKIMAAGS